MNEEEFRKQLFEINEQILKVRLLTKGEPSEELESLMKAKKDILEKYNAWKSKLMLEEIEDEKYKGR